MREKRTRKVTEHSSHEAHAASDADGPVQISVTYGNIPALGLGKLERAS